MKNRALDVRKNLRLLASEGINKIIFFQYLCLQMKFEEEIKRAFMNKRQKLLYLMENENLLKS